MSIVFTKKSLIPSPVIITVYNESPTETLPEGLAINIYDSGNRACARLADNKTMDTLCHGFAIRDIEPLTWGEIKTGGLISNLIDADPGQIYFLGENGHIVTDAPYQPYIEDKIIQEVGFAASSSELYIKIEPPVGINLPPTPEPPLLLEPDDHATVHNPVHFSWQPVIGSTSADYYNIQVSQYHNFSVKIINDDIYQQLEANYSFAVGTYYWRVASVAMSQKSDWSDIKIFRVE